MSATAAPPAERVLRSASIAAERLRLSVVVPNYCTADFVGDAIRSLLTQTIDDLEVVVVDDGSTDASLQRILAFDDPRLTVVARPNGGLSAARNTGIRHARAGLIGFCDSDDVWYPRKAEAQLAVMAAAPEVAITSSNSRYLREDGTETGLILASPYAELDALRLLRRNHVGNGSTAIVRAAVFREVGGFDETLASCEDWEMWVRITARTGGRVRHLVEPLTGYRVREGSLTTSFSRYLAAAELAMQRVRAHLPGASRRALAHAHAELLRVASRKAFSAGHHELSRTLLADAIRRSPSLPLREARAGVLALIHLCAALTPRPLRPRLYALLGRGATALHARRYAGLAGAAASRLPSRAG